MNITDLKFALIVGAGFGAYTLAIISFMELCS